jgi:chromosome partitioning protein
LLFLIDTDSQQGSASQWYKTRLKNEKELNIKTKINLFSINSPEALEKQIDDWQEIFDFIVIDGVPQTSEITIVTISISDIIILPVQPSPFDLWGVDVILAWIKKAKMIRNDIKVYFVVNRGSSLTNITQESIDLYKNLGHQVASTMLVNRVAYAEAALGGLAVTEYSDKEASNEIKKLYYEIVNPEVN